MKLINLYRIGRWFYDRKIPIIPKIIYAFQYLLFNCHVPISAKIGKGTALGYGGIGVVIHDRAVIGENCVIGTNVTIGGTSKIYGVPKIGNYVQLSTGSKILGDITIGDHVVVGANAVVIRDVPSNCVVAGVPAKIIKEGILLSDYR